MSGLTRVLEISRNNEQLKKGTTKKEILASYVGLDQFTSGLLM